MSKEDPLFCISPVDGRYSHATSELREYFSEYALIRYRMKVEAEYLISLLALKQKGMPLPERNLTATMRKMYRSFSLNDAAQIKKAEKITNHDIKALEYFIREKLRAGRHNKYEAWVHFGLTSQDINNTALPMMLRDAHLEVIHPLLIEMLNMLTRMSERWKKIPMPAHTHGQPASPTLLGKEIRVFAERMEQQIAMLSSVPFSAKFGGATGNLNAHYAAYPKYDWHGFADDFIRSLGLKRQSVTTQIEHYDGLAAWFDALRRINVLLIDLCRDFWMYISKAYFRLRIVEGEVGSSAMPHKVNPIDFENAEGNLGLANALLAHFSEKLPVSRMQRDLSDSTVTRNFGTALAHCVIAYKSVIKGMDKLEVDCERLSADLENNWQVLAEAIQTIMKREGADDAYEKLKELTRTGKPAGKKEMHALIDKLPLKASVKTELKKLTPGNYTGKANY